MKVTPSKALYRYPRGLRLAVFGLGVLIAPASAHADGDPFQFVTDHWISFDHYKENTKSGRIPAQPTPTAETAQEPAVTTSPTPTATAPAAPTGATAVATPARPLNPPLMPGLNKGYDIRVQSTTDDQAAEPQAAQITNIDTTPELHLRSQNWQNASEAVSHIKNTGNIDGETTATHSLDVRMTYLPNPKIAPSPPAPKKSNHGRPPPQAQIAQNAAPEAAKKTPAELAACAAVDAYKKKQLQAIESDRQTLEALQSAIAQLGLQKQLNFLNDAQGSVKTQAQNMDTAPLPDKAGTTTKTTVQ